MGLGLRLDVRQTQTLVMTPQLQQAIKLLQMSNAELSGFVADEIERNPLLTRETPEHGESEAPAPEAEGLSDDPGAAVAALDGGAENLFDEGGGDPWRSRATLPRGGEGETGIEDWLADAPSRSETLAQQIAAGAGPPEARLCARALVAELDENGYLPADEAELSRRLGVDPATLALGIARLQACEPTGIGARSLGECLSLQLAERDRLDPAMAALLANLDLLAEGRLRAVRTRCGVDEADFADMLAELRSLDPRPGSRFDGAAPPSAIPDILLRRTPWGGWDLELNPETLPKLLIDRRYAARLEAGGADSRAFAQECRASANWLIRTLEQRANTILKVATAILCHQERFFEVGLPGLRPLTLRMIAEEAGIHESTASRVTANKYIGTERGLFELRFFFTNALGDGDGQTAEWIRHKIKTMIAAERPEAVLSDDQIVATLKEDGIVIARRTVAKYRKSLGLASSIDRRRRKMALG